MVLSILVLPVISQADETMGHDLKKQIVGVESLSPELRDLLSKEMRALQNGMMSIIPAYASGNWQEIESIANKMHESYILKQSLTENQIKELHTQLPRSFIEEDQNFHYLASMLSHVAKNKKVELVGFYFSKLTEACVSCHEKYAVHKFPGLVPVKENNGHSH